MSEMYEGVAFRTDEATARGAFEAVTSSIRLRLVCLAEGVFGAHRVANRTDAFDQPAIERVAMEMSACVGLTIALFYDNRCSIRSGVLYNRGRRVQVFGDDDSWWVPYGEDGQLLLDGPRYRFSELRPDVEYDCILSAIDAGLEAVGARAFVDAELVKRAFCYDGLETLAER
jgi:hypothetical protein